MTYFPYVPDQYYVDNDKNILQRMEDDYNKTIVLNQSYWNEADIDNRFVAGDQALYNENQGGSPIYRKKNWNFNRLRRSINMITGYQRQHRKSTIVNPIEQASQATADQMTKLMYHVNNNGHVLETISEAFEGACVAGMNLLSVWVDWTKDPVNGDIVVDNLSYNGFLIDPFFKKKDLSDCNSVWIRKYVSRTQAKSLLPGREDEIKAMQSLGNRDGKFMYMPESFSYAQKDLLTYDEYSYMSSRTAQLIVDTETGETTEWRGQDEDLKAFLGSYPQTIVLKQEIPSVRTAIVLQGRVMYHGTNPSGLDRYPYVPVWCYYQPEIPYFPQRIQGIIRGARDAQFLYSRRMIATMSMIESQINSGWKYKENALVNPKDVFLSGDGRGLAMKAESQMTDAEQILPPQIPPSILQLSEMLANEINQITGINEELLGSAIDDKAGILAQARQGAGLITLQGIFDNLDQSQRLLGSLCMELWQQNWTPGKVMRIINEEPSQEFYNRAFSTYDCIVEEAPVTSTQKQLALQQSLYLREMGVLIPSEYILGKMQLPDKNKLMEQIKAQEEQQQQQEQQQAELQMQQIQVDNETKISFAESQRAAAEEKIQKGRLDTIMGIEKLEEAEEKKALADLNRAKLLKELEGMDLTHIGQAIQFLQQMAMTSQTQQMVAGERQQLASQPTTSQGQPQQQIQQPNGQQQEQQKGVPQQPQQQMQPQIA